LGGRHVIVTWIVRKKPRNPMAPLAWMDGLDNKIVDRLCG
jgi:hypothetical protein